MFKIKKEKEGWVDTNKGFIPGVWYTASCNNHFYKFKEMNGTEYITTSERLFNDCRYCKGGRSNHCIEYFNPENRADVNEVNKRLKKAKVI